MNYFIILFIPTLLYVFEELYNIKGNYFRKLAILFISLFVSLRYGLGVDYFTYQNAFYNISSGNFIDKFEPGYILLNFVVGYFGFGFHFMLFIIAVFNYMLLYLSIEYYMDKYKWVGLFLFLITFDLFIYTLSAIRQSIALSIFLYASRYIVQQNWKKYFLLVLMGALFHLSIIVLLPIYQLYNYIRNKNYIFISYILLIAIISYSSVSNLINLISPFLDNKLAFYLIIEKSASPTLPSYPLAGFYVIVILAILYTLYQSEHLIINRNSDKISFPLFAVLIFLVLKTMQNIEYYSILPRLQLYFYSFFIFVVPKIFSAFTLSSRFIVIAIICAASIYFFILKYFEIITYASQYYKNFNIILF